MDIVLHKYRQAVTYKCSCIIVADRGVVSHERRDTVPYFVDSDVTADYFAYLAKVPEEVVMTDRPSRFSCEYEVVFLFIVNNSLFGTGAHELEVFHTAPVFNKESAPRIIGFCRPDHPVVSFFCFLFHGMDGTAYGYGHFFIVNKNNIILA